MSGGPGWQHQSPEEADRHGGAVQGRSGLPGGDHRRIQTAVLGAVDSQQPVVLPLEAIELGAFREQYADQTFWCGSVVRRTPTQGEP